MTSRITLIALLGGALISLNACAAQPQATAPVAAISAAQADALTEGVFAERPVRLSDVHGQCALTHGEQPAITLDMQWPCRFSETPQHTVRIEKFGQSPILMVERSEKMAAPDNDCITDRQVVRWFKGKLDIAPVGRIAACGPAQWDQKAFIGMFDW